ncbi:MAG: hypothetical protein ACRCX2_16765 [Paraclostridium sp.]
MEKRYTFNKEEFIKDLEDLSVQELRSLVEALESHFGVTSDELNSLNYKIGVHMHRSNSMQRVFGNDLVRVHTKTRGSYIRSKNRVTRTKK